ncbi:3-deoxy-manno-octulosonate cytidylyltransferase [Parafilimonas terrae]|uniref:3-deoxy-manno-octulosonate cytidylyltransferase (CMP-KDO synthetase) n=1 Tax=Parafilimonas terrae TaxID=1465490 RepID=A0A1I5Z0L3_9BACT|nr:3-deoxy-manno-octulosonate cytidylyltransferase [Parafilimonas terrae]SFQ49855.1 3-deoxy-manno-octulosonate cytidylyltransferase (CMP-KDO synthetase) [Parafilimonas terrae]
MKKIAVIPARYASMRFPAKLMQMLGEKTIIKTTYDNTVATGLFDYVMVVTDSEIIYNELQNDNVVMSKRNHESGSDRIAEAIADVDCDVIINVQGDEPFVDSGVLKGLLSAFDDKCVNVASVMHELFEQGDIENPNNVKVVVNKNNDALYFSRSVIPFIRDAGTKARHFKHIGIYGYRKEALLKFTTWPAGELEKIEKLEQLRYLENGINIRMVLTNHASIGIDTPEDLKLADQFLKQQQNINN